MQMAWSFLSLNTCIIKVPENSVEVSKSSGITAATLSPKSLMHPRLELPVIQWQSQYKTVGMWYSSNHPMSILTCY